MDFSSPNRRQSLVAAAALAFWTGTARAAPPLVEIVAFAHAPVQSALEPLRDWLAKQGTKLKVVEIDMETPEAERRLQAVGVKGHVPVVVLIDGQYRHKRADGSTVEFVSFPAAAGTPPGGKGAWSSADVEAVLRPRIH